MRFGGSFASARAAASTVATPDASSSAPLLIESPSTGLPIPMWSKWAPSTTASLRSERSDPRIRPTRL